MEMISRVEARIPQPPKVDPDRVVNAFRDLGLSARVDGETISVQLKSVEKAVEAVKSVLTHVLEYQVGDTTTFDGDEEL